MKKQQKGMDYTPGVVIESGVSLTAHGIRIQPIPPPAPGVIYLLHLDEAFSVNRVRHILGWVDADGHDISRHHGIITAATRAGVTVRLVHTCPGTLQEYRKAQQPHAKTMMCPLCRDEYVKTHSTGRPRGRPRLAHTDAYRDIA